MTPTEQVILGIVHSILKGVQRVGPEEVARAAEMLGRARTDRAAAGLALFCRHFLAAYENSNYDIETNGERLVLRRLAMFKPSVVFDVGANIGGWLLAARTEMPEAHFHAFEIVPATFAALERKVPNGPKMTLNGFGLSDVAGTVTMHDFQASSQLASHVPYPHGPYCEIVCPVRRGEDYMAERGLSRIDFLKIDVEGAEHLVLSGFGNALDTGAIDVIQFEYGKLNIMTHFLLADFYALLESKGYTVGKIYPERVDFRPYDLDDEDFLGPNYLAVRRARQDMINALR